VAKSDILFAGIDESGEIVFDDRFAASHDTPVCDRDNGGTDDWSFVGVSREGEYLVRIYNYSID
jgi:hypothetical protein